MPFAFRRLPHRSHSVLAGCLMNPLFIVLDGVEGCGKSTQVRLLAVRLEQESAHVVVTHEPGGTPVGEGVRALLLDPAYPEMTPLTEVMLFCASRAQHCAQVIVPALAAGKMVVCDRFASSTAVYQGYAGGLGMDAITRVNDVATAGLEPDLLIVLDLDPAVGMRRKFGEQAAHGDRIEEKSAQFHQKVREGFLEYARLRPERSAVVSADAPPEEIHRRVWEHVKSRLIRKD
jgi:dTMP kinase